MRFLRSFYNNMESKRKARNIAKIKNHLSEQKAAHCRRKNVKKLLTLEFKELNELIRLRNIVDRQIISRSKHFMSTIL